jgi:hypothetical protein
MYVFQKDLKDTASFFVNQPRDTLNTATAGKTTNGRLSNTYYSRLNSQKNETDNLSELTLDVVAQDLTVALGAALSKSL